MKTAYLYLTIALLCVFGITPNANATHIAGGEITYQNVGQDSFLVSLNLYWDCSSTLTLGMTELLTISDDCGINYPAVTLNQVYDEEVSQLCSSVSSTCNGGTYAGMRHYVYEAIVVLDQGDCDDITFSWDVCCRNTSLNTTTQDEIYIETVMSQATDPNNSSPYFTASPIPYVCNNQPVYFNFGVVESDGDSMNYSFTDALQAAGTVVGYEVGYSGAAPIPGAAIDLLTGEVTFTPTLQGNFIFAVLVEEFDPITGELIGTITRDIQFVVIDQASCTGPLDTTGVINNLGGDATATGSYALEMCDGGEFFYQVFITDPDTADTVTLTSNVSQVLPGATFVTVPGNPAVGTIMWDAPGGGAAYLNNFTIVAQDDNCPIVNTHTFTYTVTVFPSTTISDDTLIICGTQTAEFTVSGGSMFDWTALPGGDVIDTSMNFFPTDSTFWSVEADPDSTTWYHVESNLSTQTCIVEDSILVMVVPDFVYSKAQTDTSICLNELVTFTIDPDSFDYNWNNTPFLTEFDTSVVTATIDQSGLQGFPFTVGSVPGCIKPDTFWVQVSSGVQPDISIIADTTVCLGDSVQCIATQAGLGTIFTDNFDGGATAANWVQNTGTNNAACGTYAGDALYFDAVNRVAETVDLNVPMGGTINFYLFISQGFNAGCEMADLGDEVHLDYSTDGGASWTSMNIYDVTAYPAFAFVSENIPAGAQTSSTRFRWSQPVFAGTGTDNWAIDEVQITGTQASYAYSWSDATLFSDPLIQNPLCGLTQDTLVTVIVTDTVGLCSDTASMWLTVVPTFTYTTAQTDTAICLLGTVDFTLDPQIAGTYSYVWADTMFLDQTDTAIATVAMIDSSGTLVWDYEITNEWGCTKTDSFVVAVSSGVQPVVLVTGDSTMCAGDSVELSFENGLVSSCDWTLVLTDSWGDGWINTSAPAVTAFVNVFINGALQGQYTILNPGTINTIVITVNQGDQLEIVYDHPADGNLDYQGENEWVLYDADGNFAAGDGQGGVTPSAGSVYNAVANCVGDYSNYTYEWIPGGSAWVSDSSIAPTWVTPTIDTTYQLVVTDTVGNCTDTGSFNVYVVPSFTYSATADDYTLCGCQEVQLEITDDASSVFEYQWWPSEFLDNDTVAAPVGSGFSPTGTYTLWYEVSTALGCNKVDSIVLTISENPEPIAVIVGDSTLCEGDQVDLQLQIGSACDSCYYELGMYDDWGNGWEGAVAVVTINGVTDTLTLDGGQGGDSVFYQIGYIHGDNIQLEYIPGDILNENENSYYWADNNGGVMYEDGLGGSNPDAGIVWIGYGLCDIAPVQSYTYGWCPTTSLSDTTILSPICTPPTDETLCAWVVDTISGCSDSTSFNIYTVSDFGYDTTQSATAICLSESVDFEVIPDTAGVFTYVWQPDTTLNNNNISDPTGTFYEGGTQWVVFDITSDLGCTKTDSFSVVVSPGLPPDISIVGPTTACIGDTIEYCVVNASEMPSSTDIYTVTNVGYNPDGTTGGTQVFLGDDELTAAIPIGFTFTFFGNDYNDFYISSNGFVTFDPAAGNGCCQGQVIPDNGFTNNLIALAWDDLNPGSGGTIDYQTIGTAPNQTLIVNFTGVMHFGSVNPVTVQMILVEGSNEIYIYILDVTSDGSPHTIGIENADGSAGFTVPGFNAGIDTALNQGFVFAPLELNGPLEYVWSPGGIVFTPDSSCTEVYTTADTTITVVVSDTLGGCSDQAGITLDITLYPVVDYTGDTAFCETQFADSLTASPAGGTWSGTGINPNGIFSANQISGDTTYVTYTVDLGGCVNNEVIMLQIDTVPSAPSGAVDPEYCAGFTVTGEITNGNGGTYTWYNSAGDSVGTGATASLGIATNSSDTFYVTQTDWICESAPSGAMTISILETPVASFTTQLSDESGQIPLTATFTNTTTPTVGVTYDWNFGDSNTSTEQDPVNVYETQGLFEITMVASNSLGCFDSAFYEVLATQFLEMQIPVVFSPGNNDGLNDKWSIQYAGLGSIEVTVFDRWGIKVFEGTEADETGPGINNMYKLSWDGNNLKGHECTEGTYFYIIRGMDTNGNLFSSDDYNLTGHITLLREQ